MRIPPKNITEVLAQPKETEPMESPALKTAIEGLNREKEILTANIAALAHKGKYIGQTALEDRLREIDKEIRALLEPLTKTIKFEPCTITNAKNADKPKAPTHSHAGATTENSATPAATASTQQVKRAESKKDN